MLYTIPAVLSVKLFLFHQVVAESELRLRQLSTNKDELLKFEEELARFNQWVDQAESDFRSLERSAGDLSKLDEHKNKCKVSGYCLEGFHVGSSTDKVKMQQQGVTCAFLADFHR